MSDNVSDSIEKLYKNFGILADADKEKIGEHESEYLEILAAVKGSAKEKRLASQFIARFFKFFPPLADQALEAQLDLCEDEDVSIRKQAIKDLAVICKDSRDQLPKIADILAQLLQAEDSSEIIIVQDSLLSLLNLDAKGTLSGIYSQLLTGDDLVRERCIRFLNKKLLPLDRNIITKPAEDLLIIETKKVLQDVTGDEFIQLLHVLCGTRLSQTVPGQKELVDIIADQADLDHPFNPQDESHIDRIIHCTHAAVPLFSSQVESSRFVQYLCEQVLPKLNTIPEEIKNFKYVHLEILKALAESCTHCISLSNAAACFESVLNVLYRYLPLPPADPKDKSDFQFSHVEAALYALHRLGKICADPVLASPERFKEFRSRLQYLACSVQGYNKGLRENLRGKNLDLKDEAQKLKLLALKTTNNINVIIRDLFHNPPRFQATVVPSWKQPLKVMGNDFGDAVVAHEATANRKRKVSDVSTHGKQKHRPEGREIYHPPGGKYSKSVLGYGGSGRGGWRSRRGREYAV